MKKIYVGSDHAGYKVKESLLKYLEAELDYDVVDCGPFNSSRVDYPDIADLVCEKVLKNTSNSFGFLICGSGQGVSMRANKYKDIRAALCWTAESAKLSREHNHANVLCVGARLLELNVIKSIAKTFFTTEEEGGRHLQRVKKLSKATS